jgi:hypothetical protein
VDVLKGIDSAMRVANEKTFKVDIDEAVVDAFTAWADGRGLKYKVATEKLMLWFIDQIPEVQSVILGDIDAKTDLIELIMKRMNLNLSMKIQRNDNLKGRSAASLKGQTKDTPM